MVDKGSYIKEATHDILSMVRMCFTDEQGICRPKQRNMAISNTRRCTSIMPFKTKEDVNIRVNDA